MSKLHLHFVSELGGSIGEITRDLCDFFSEEYILTKDWDEEVPVNRQILFCHFLKPDFVDSPRFKDYKLRVIIQPIDGTSIKKKFVNMLNRFDLIITPAMAGKKIMQRNGVLKPIEVIPNYIKSNILDGPVDVKFKAYIDKQIGSRKVIYHESTFHPRKGIDLLYESYVRAFSDTENAEKVVLLLKDSEANKITLEKNEQLKLDAISLQKKYKRPAKILKLSCNLEEDEIKYLWKICDIYVSMSRMEGFGIPLLRMMSLGKPILTINSKNNGYMDYLNNNNAVLIPSKNVLAKDEFMWIYGKDTTWASPSIVDCIDGFRKVFSSFNQFNLHRTDNDSSYFHFDNVCKTYASVIEEYFKKNK